MEEVWQLLPADLVAAVPRNARGLREAVLDALATGTPYERTPQQLVTHRVMPRWTRHFAAQFEAGRVGKPVGVLQALLKRDPLCNDDRCDEHVDVDTSQPCRACERTREDRRTDRVVPQPRSTPRLADTRPAGGETFTPPAYAPEPVVEAVPPTEAVRQARAALRAGKEHRSARRDRTPWMPAG